MTLAFAVTLIGIAGSYGERRGEESSTGIVNELPAIRTSGWATVFSYVAGETLEESAIADGALGRIVPQAYAYVGPAGLMFEGDREDLLELAGNLIDNACKWCRREVRISASAETGLVLRVEDDGPGAPSEDLAALTQRGMRGDDSRAGSGLGLAIADEVARSYGGAVQFAQSAELGGLRVEAILSPERAR